MGIFKKTISNTANSVSIPAEEPETYAEQEYMRELSEGDVIQQTPVKTQPVPEKENSMVREIPVCMSQEQINNLVIENNIILKEILTHID